MVEVRNGRRADGAERRATGRTVDAQCRERPDTDAAQSRSALGALALGAFALGASAIGALAIGILPLAHSL